MMKKNDAAEQSLRKTYINIVSVVVFALLMALAIGYLYRAEPDVQSRMMSDLSRQFAASASNTHWQWQAEGRPEMIMLVHYDTNGHEVGRRPVRMAHYGWPHIGPNSESCMQVWEQLLNMPSRVDGFRVIGEYYANDAKEHDVSNARCRFKLSTGPYFDYLVYTGQVIDGQDD